MGKKVPNLLSNFAHQKMCWPSCSSRFLLAIQSSQYHLICHQIWLSNICRRQLRVFEINQVLPRFVTFIQMDQMPEEPPESFVSFRMHSRPDQLRIWIAENFVFIDEEKLMSEGGMGPPQNGIAESKNRIQLCFKCTRNQEPLLFEWDLSRPVFELFNDKKGQKKIVLIGEDLHDNCQIGGHH